MADDRRDLDALAQRFLDLWQQQFAASVGDPALAEWIARYLATPAAAAPAPAPHAERDTVADIVTGAAAGAAAAAASHGAGDDRVDELARRLAECEKRLAALESAARAGGKPARRKPRRGRS